MNKKAALALAGILAVLVLLFCCAAGVAGLALLGNRPDQAKTGSPKGKLEPTNPPAQLTVKHQQMDARQWAVLLGDSDEETSRRAIAALTAIGDEAIPFAVAAFKSPVPHVRRHALGVGTVEIQKKHRQQLTPLYRSGLKDSSAIVRSAAAHQIGITDCKECLGDLRAAHANETDPGIADQMRHTIDRLKK